jgi:hypothetical protein
LLLQVCPSPRITKAKVKAKARSHFSVLRLSQGCHLTQNNQVQSSSLHLGPIVPISVPRIQQAQTMSSLAAHASSPPSVWMSPFQGGLC